MKDFAPDPHIDCFGEDVYKQWRRCNIFITKFMNSMINVVTLINEVNKSVNLLVSNFDHRHYFHEHQDGHEMNDISDYADFERFTKATICLPTFFTPVEGLLAEYCCGENVTEINPTKTFGYDYRFYDGADPYISVNYDGLDLVDFKSNITWEIFEEFKNNRVNQELEPKPITNSIKPPKPGENPKLNIKYPDEHSPPETDPDYWSSEYETGIITPNPIYGPISNPIISDVILPGSIVSDDFLIRRLVVEFITQQDLDDNNLIYGIDFIIDPACSNKPQLLINIENSKKKRIIANTPCFQSEEEIIYNPFLFSWNDYLLTIGLGEVIEQVLLNAPTKIRKDIINDLIRESVELIDVDGDGFIYGKDFIIFGPNTPIELKPHYPLLCPSIMMTWDTYLSYLQYQFVHQSFDYWVDLLLLEYETKTDLDDNNLIYGINFAIEDVYKIQECGKIYANPISIKLFEKYIPIDVPKISWDDYVLTLNVTPKNSQKLYYDELSVKLSSEFLSVKHNSPMDYDYNKLVYGLDIMLTDYCPDKTGHLWDIDNTEKVRIVRNIGVLKRLKRKFNLPKHMKEIYTDLEYEEFYGDPPEYSSDYSDCIGMLRNELMKYSNNDPIHNLSQVPNQFKFPKNILLITWYDLLTINGVI